MADRHIDEFGKYSTFHFAYLKGLTEVMRHDVKPLNAAMRVGGRAFTVSGPAIYLNVLREMGPGCVVVHADTAEGDGVWSGGMSKLYGAAAGIAGVVVDGGVYLARDIIRSDLPVFARYVTPRPAANRLEGTIQMPVTCAGVEVHPGDIIVGDSDGVVVVPQAKQDEVLEGLTVIGEGFAYFSALMVPPTQKPWEDPDLMAIFKIKDGDPINGWRGYKEWAATLREKHGEPDELGKHRRALDHP